MKKSSKTILENYKLDSKNYDIATLKKFIGKDIIVSVLNDYMFIADGILKEVKEDVLVFDDMEIEYIKVYDLIIKNSNHSEEYQLSKLPKSENSPSIEVTYDLAKSLEGKFISYYEFDNGTNTITDEFGKLINVNKENITIDTFNNFDMMDLIEYDNGLKFIDESNLDSSPKTYNYNQIKGLRKLEISSLLDFIDVTYLYQNCKITLYNDTVVYAYIVSIDIDDIEFKFKGESDELGDVYIGDILTTDIKSIDIL